MKFLKRSWDIFKLIFLSISILGIWTFIYFLFIYLTDGYGRGFLAALISIMITLLCCYFSFKKFKQKSKISKIWGICVTAALFIAFIIYTLIPVASGAASWKIDPPKEDIVQFWNLKTGSKIAYYKLPAKEDKAKKSIPIIFLHGGPGAYVRQLDIDFFRQFTADGYDVYLYDQAGGGRSGLLPKEEYSNDRNIADFEGIIDMIGSPKYIVIGQSYGAVLLSHIAANKKNQKRISKAIYVEPGETDADQGEITYAKSPHIEATDVNLPLRLFLALLISPKGDFASQNEIINYTLNHQNIIQELYRESYPRKDMDKVTEVELGVLNFAANAIIKSSITKTQNELEEAYKKVKIPSMLILGESSYIERNAPMNLLKINKNINRIQYMKGVGHIIWNGLYDNNVRAKHIIDDFLNNKPSKIPNYPETNQINDFLKQRL